MGSLKNERAMATVRAHLPFLFCIVIGKASLSEFANWKGNITNGWSGESRYPSSLRFL